MCVGTHGGQGEAVDDFVGAGLDDGKNYAAFDDEAALSSCAASPACACMAAMSNVDVERLRVMRVPG